jgi:lipoyl synthase
MRSPSNPQSPIPNPSLPRWLKRNVPKGNANHFTAKLIGQLGLQTVCDHAKCPNRMECYSQKTATFLILGDVCTRACRFCSVKKGNPLPPEVDAPRRVAEAARTLGLEHVVITCVTRDDLPDGGAEQFVRTIEAIRGTGEEVASGQAGLGPWVLGLGVTRLDEDLRPKTQDLNPPISKSPNLQISKSSTPTIEVLPSDFAGNLAAVDRLVDAAPEVYNHNTETVPRLFPAVREKKPGKSEIRNPKSEIPKFPNPEIPKSLAPSFPDYAWTLEMFRHIHRRNPAIALKTGLMLGLGETTEELLDTLADLLEAGCSRLTLGQYLRPSPAQMPVVRYVPPEEFERLGELARRMGFQHVAAGPFVRSSYHAREMMA